MKKSELRQIIKEEIQRVLNEYTLNSFDVDAQVEGYGNQIDPSLLSSLLPESAQTATESEERLRSFEGGEMWVHSQVFYCVPKGQDGPLYYFGQSQYYLRNETVNVTMLLIKEVPNINWISQDRDKVKNLGWALVNTDIFLREARTLYDIVKKIS